MRLPALPTLPSSEHELPLWPPLLATRGRGTKSALHAHHALHLVLALQGRLAWRDSARGPWTETAGVVTAPDTLHSIDARGSEVLLVFFEPESQVGAALAQALGGALCSVSERDRDALARAAADPRAIMGSEGARSIRASRSCSGCCARPASKTPRRSRRWQHEWAYHPGASCTFSPSRSVSRSARILRGSSCSAPRARSSRAFHSLPPPTPPASPMRDT